MTEDIAEVDEILGELVKEGKSVKDLLTEMKNVSELMIDLAYSAVLFDNDELALEVLQKILESLAAGLAQVAHRLIAQPLGQGGKLCSVGGFALAAADALEGVEDDAGANAAGHALSAGVVAEALGVLAR